MGKKHNTIKVYTSTANKLRHRRDDFKGVTSYKVRGINKNQNIQNPPRSVVKRFLRKDIVDEYALAKQYRLQIGNLADELVPKEVIEKLVALEAQAYKAAKELEVIVKDIPN